MRPLYYWGSLDTLYKFEELSEDLLNDCAYSSSTQAYTDHPNFQQILELGDEVVPLLIHLFARDKCIVWHYALKKITNHDPVTPDISGNIRLIAEAWVEFWLAARRTELQAEEEYLKIRLQRN